jgi:threonine/homoserine efflux transporter RhtA
LLAVGVAACEIPATVALYFYLSQMARSLKRPPWGLRWMILLAPLASGLPLLAFVLNHYFHINPHDVPLTIAAAMAIAGSLAVTLLGASSVLRLAWGIAHFSLARGTPDAVEIAGRKGWGPCLLAQSFKNTPSS